MERGRRRPPPQPVTTPNRIVRGLLVRVGIDSTDGAWNAPLRNVSGDFVYITITETKSVRPSLVRRYEELVPALARFGLRLPTHLQGQPTHLDPDFDHLTYGDQGQRGRAIATLQRHDLLAFFASFRSLDDPDTPLVYALIGLYVVDEIVAARSVPRNRWHENAHTRRDPGGWRHRCPRLSRRFGASQALPPHRGVPQPST